MSTKATENARTDDLLMEEFQRGQRSNRLKGFMALLGVAAVIVILFIAFTQMATVG